MDAEGRRFLRFACDEGKVWASKFSTLADAWEACKDADWMLWAINELRIGDVGDSRKTASELRDKFGNPFVRTPYCFFCGAGPLTDNEKRDSEIVGSLSRCRSHLVAVGLAA